MKTTQKNLRFPSLPVALLLAAMPVRAAGLEEAAASPGGVALLFVMGVALLLVGVIAYVLRLVAGLGASSRQETSGPRATAPEKFAPYLEELDGSQLDALQRLPHAQSSLPTLLINDHAKEQLV
jgi:hypothetical protein